MRSLQGEALSLKSEVKNISVIAVSVTNFAKGESAKIMPLTAACDAGVMRRGARG